MGVFEELEEMVSSLRRSYKIDLYACTPEDAPEAHSRCMSLIDDVIAVLERAVSPGVLADEYEIKAHFYRNSDNPQ
jgi:hypothetical protein